MPRQEDSLFSILIVSGSGQFAEALRREIPPHLYVSVEIRQNASAARRSILERDYDIILINVPLPDETGMEFSLDIVDLSGASVLLAAPREIYEDALEYVTDRGILVLPKPLEDHRAGYAIRYLLSIRTRIREMENRIQSLQEKAEENRLVTRAKFLLVEKKHYTEEEAHRFIGKQAMDHGLSRGRVARQILDDLE